MTFLKSALLLAGLLSAGSIFSAENRDYGRHVKKQGDVLVVAKRQLPDVPSRLIVAYIDADLLDFHHKTQAQKNESTRKIHNEMAL